MRPRASSRLRFEESGGGSRRGRYHSHARTRVGGTRSARVPLVQGASNVEGRGLGSGGRQRASGRWLRDADGRHRAAGLGHGRPASGRGLGQPASGLGPGASGSGFGPGARAAGSGFGLQASGSRPRARAPGLGLGPRAAGSGRPASSLEPQGSGFAAGVSRFGATSRPPPPLTGTYEAPPQAPRRGCARSGSPGAARRGSARPPFGPRSRATA